MIPSRRVLSRVCPFPPSLPSPALTQKYGAHIYIFPHIFPNWPDEACVSVPRHTVSVMAPSWLVIIADRVSRNSEDILFSLLLDVGMMMLAGMERRAKKPRWERCLGHQGKVLIGCSCLLQELHFLDP